MMDPNFAVQSRHQRRSRRMLAMAAAWMVFLTSAAQPQDIQLASTSRPVAQSLAEFLLEQIESLESQDLTFEADATQALALQSEDRSVEVLLVPAKGLKDDPDNPFLHQDRGVPVGYLQLHGVVPAEGRQSQDLFYSLTRKDGSNVLVAVLSVQKLSGSEFRLQLWGRADSPLAAVPLFVARDVDARPVGLHWYAGLIECAWMGKYRAYLPVDLESNPK